MSFGPVQGFIAQARSSSDLWAGSHLLSSIVWEAIRTIAETIGPDAVLFPALRGVPAVDTWLVDELGEQGAALFGQIGAKFLTDKTDTNPLFAAALPNKFVVLVPASQARELAEKSIEAARRRARAIAEQAAHKLFDEANNTPLTDGTRDQIAAQVDEFPEAFWASVTWPVGRDVKEIDAAAGQLQSALDAIHDDLKRQGIFHPNVWSVLTRKLQLEGFEFWRPNAGILYPAVYELAERSLAAAKSARPFNKLTQKGHRCTQCGEREWLTDNPDHLELNRTDRKAVSVWGKLSRTRPSWAKEGEHLCAVCTAKRFWPTLFSADVGGIVGERVSRFVVSTHALALATSLDRLLDGYGPKTIKKLARIGRDHDLSQDEPAALPKALHDRIRRTVDANAEYVLKRLPSALDRLRDTSDECPLDKALADLFGKGNKPEAYYALIQMDGDRMGAWLAGNEDRYKMRYRETWHPQVAAKVGEFAKSGNDSAKVLAAYLETFRPPSPARHAAISRALNDFSIHLARHVVEDCCKGKLLYAGGDDVLALVSVDDLFDAMLLLRLAYSGLNVPESLGLSRHVVWLNDKGRKQGDGRLWMKNGFGFLAGPDHKSGRLMTLMGHKATASLGAVVAHHTAPLGMVLRQLREAESRAKQYQRLAAPGVETDRDAFCILPGERDSVEAPRVYTRDSRLGIGLGADPRTVESGLIYTTEGFAFCPNSSPFTATGFLVGIEGADGLLPESSHLRLGGDGRSAQCRRVAWQPPAVNPEAIRKFGRFRITLATPGLFGEGWLPEQVVEDEGVFRLMGDGFSARLACAAVPRREVVSGWDLFNWKPKAAQRAVPAGSVYWFDGLQGDPGKLAGWIESGLWGENPDKQRRSEGYNLAWMGTWNDEEKPTCTRSN